MVSGEMYVCLVCHTESDVWNGGLYSIDLALPRFLEAIESVKDALGRSLVAWCLTDHVMRHRADVFRKLAEAGHEVGVHSHYPHGDDGALGHDQALNRAHLADLGQWLPHLCSLAEEAGLPRPRVHVSWMFAYRDAWTAVLAACGISVDCSVCYGGAHYLPDGFLLADSRQRQSGKPYRLSDRNHCMEGGSPVVELPVSGGFGDYWEPDEAGGFSHFSPSSSDQQAERQLRLFRARVDGLAPGEVDVFHVHFHLYDFVPPGGLSNEIIERVRRLLEAMGQDGRVRFSTPTEAAEAWERWRREVGLMHGRTSGRTP